MKDNNGKVTGAGVAVEEGKALQPEVVVTEKGKKMAGARVVLQPEVVVKKQGRKPGKGKKDERKEKELDMLLEKVSMQL